MSYTIVITNSMTDEEILKFISELQTIDIVTHRKSTFIPDNDLYAYYREDHRRDIEGDGLVFMYKYRQNYLFDVCRKSSKIDMIIIGEYKLIKSDPIIKKIFPDDIKMVGRFIYLPVRNFGSTYTKLIEPLDKYIEDKITNTTDFLRIKRTEDSDNQNIKNIKYMKTDKFIYIGTTSKRIIRLWKNGSKDDAIQLRGIENLFSHCNKDVKLSFCGKLKINVSQEDCYGCGMKDKIQTARLFLDCYQIMMEEI